VLYINIMFVVTIVWICTDRTNINTQTIRKGITITKPKSNSVTLETHMCLWLLHDQCNQILYYMIYKSALNVGIITYQMIKVLIMNMYGFTHITFLVLKAINLVCKTSLDFSGIKATQTGSLSNTHTTYLLKDPKVHASLVLCPTCLAQFFLTSLANTHHLLIYALSFSIWHPLAGCTLLC